MQRPEGGWLGRVRSSGNQTLLPLLTLLAVVGAMLALAVPAQAAFPGANGRIAFARDVVGGDGMCDYEIDTINPDGTGIASLTSPTNASGYPGATED
jgi:hypothetical protein